jgi:hypothetical protein
MDASKYQVVINMDQNTVDTLFKEQFTLYAFKAVDGPGNGMPLVWFSTRVFGLNTKIEWTESYQVFTSRNAQIAVMTQVSVDNDYPAELGTLLTVDSPTGTGTPTSGGPAGAITVLNTTSTQMSCGISQLQGDGTYAPLAVFPLFGSNEDEMVPVEKVFLMFASATINTGTVIEKSFSPGILIDLTGAPADSSGAATRAVTYELNNNWSAAKAPWATVQPPNTELVPLLIGGGA